jgi:hypothetical protein
LISALIEKPNKTINAMIKLKKIMINSLIKMCVFKNNFVPVELIIDDCLTLENPCKKLQGYADIK